MNSIQSVNQFIELVNNNKDNIIVWGTGKYAEEVTSLLDVLKIKINFYIDNFPTSNLYRERAVLKFNEINDKNLENKLIIVASMYYQEIYRVLESRMTNIKNLLIIDCNRYLVFLGEKNKVVDNKLNIFKELFEEGYIENLNYGYPLRNRKWMNCLESDELSGFRLKKNNKYNKNYLGFNLTSNDIGLRGKYSENNNFAIFGTSFGFGFAVDENDAWFNCKEFGNFNNFSIPVGVKQLNALKVKYQKDCEMAIILYFPNFPVFFGSFKDWKGEDIFEYFNWKTDLLDCMKLQQNVFEKSFNEYTKGERVFCDYNNSKYMLDLNYYKLEIDKFDTNNYLNEWDTLINSFKKVFIFRIPTKEEVFLKNKIFYSEKLEELIKSYDLFYDMFKENYNNRNNVKIYDNLYFKPSDYHNFDTHWNSDGNRRMRDYILKYIFNN